MVSVPPFTKFASLPHRCQPAASTAKIWALSRLFLPSNARPRVAPLLPPWPRSVPLGTSLFSKVASKLSILVTKLACKRSPLPLSSLHPQPSRHGRRCRQRRPAPPQTGVRWRTRNPCRASSLRSWIARCTQTWTTLTVSLRKLMLRGAPRHQACWSLRRRRCRVVGAVTEAVTEAAAVPAVLRAVAHIGSRRQRPCRQPVPPRHPCRAVQRRATPPSSPQPRLQLLLPPSRRSCRREPVSLAPCRYASAREGRYFTFNVVMAARLELITLAKRLPFHFNCSVSLQLFF